jgi:hypothetical protein
MKGIAYTDNYTLTNSNAIPNRSWDVADYVYPAQVSYKSKY